MANNRKTDDDYSEVKALHLGTKIRGLRQEEGMTLQALSSKTNLSVPLLSQIENNLVTPPISTLLKISKAFDKDLSYFFQNYTPDTKVSIVRKEERMKLNGKGLKRGRTAYSYETLAHKKKKKHMEPFLIEIERKSRRDTPLVKHNGEEFIYIMEGMIEFRTNDDSYELEAGDSIYFESNIPHASRAIGEINAKALLIIYSEQE